MPTPRRPHSHPARPQWQLWLEEQLEGGKPALWLRLTPLALLLPVLTALLAGWGIQTHEGTHTESRYMVGHLPSLPELQAAERVGVPGLLGDLPPPVARPEWLVRRYPALVQRPAPTYVRPLAFGWLGRRQLEGG